MLLHCQLCVVLLSGLLAVPRAEQAIDGSKPKLPHIFFVVVDDFGWGDVGWHREEATKEVQTPVMDALVKQGVEFNRHYVHMTCTPTRSALQSGRLPVHVLTQLASPCDANGPIPRNMTGLAAHLKRAGYATHHVGKWDAGMTTPHHTPKGRGHDTSLSYFGHGNWAWTEVEWGGSENGRTDMPTATPGGIVDFWDTDRPASHLNGTGHEEDLFRERMLQILHAHDQSTPLFLQYHSKLCHYPLQAPQKYQDRFSFIEYDNRRMYHAMVSFLDDQLGNITNTMKKLGMWDNTLMILTADNGGYVKSPGGECNTTDASFPGAGEGTDVGKGTACFNGEAGGNNWPLRGGKYSNWEGGIRVNAFASGGYLPKAAQGTKLDGIIHVADWYRTLAQGVAGVDPTDHWAAESGLPPIDSLDVWPMLSGRNLTSPRESILVTEKMLIVGEWKYVSGGTDMIAAAQGGPHYPNASTAADPIAQHHLKCPKQGCLFNVVSDPTEQLEVSAQHPELVSAMKAEMMKQAKTIWSTSHKVDPACKRAVTELYGGFYGPFQEVEWPTASQFHSPARFV
jgi:arylsulfatase I/J